MSEFVGQHRIDLGGAELLEQCVVKHHALGRAKTREIGVGMRRALAAVHDKQAFGRKAATLHQRRDADLERLVVQRLEFVKQRRNHRGK